MKSLHDFLPATLHRGFFNTVVPSRVPSLEQAEIRHSQFLLIIPGNFFIPDKKKPPCLTHAACWWHRNDTASLQKDAEGNAQSVHILWGWAHGHVQRSLGMPGCSSSFQTARGITDLLPNLWTLQDSHWLLSALAQILGICFMPLYL